MPYNTENDLAADIESDIEQGNPIENLECLLQWHVIIMPNVPSLIHPTRNSKRQAEQVFVTGNKVKTKRNIGVKKK
jgi:hypothetical protein